MALETSVKYKHIYISACVKKNVFKKHTYDTANNM
jgi:hypothetical protein